jgi:hypothetical protein
MMNTAKKIAALELEIEKLKAAQASPPPAPTEQEVAKYRDEMHQMRERRANAFQFRPEILGPMVAACGTADLQDLARHGTVQSQSQVGARDLGTSVRSGGGVPPAGGSGWRTAAPLQPPHGVELCDRLVDHQDDLDMAKRIEENARLQTRR